MDDVIRSKDNSNAKYLHSLHNRKKASLDDVVFLEGTRLCEETLQSGIMPVIIAYTQSKKTLVLEWCKLFCISKTSVKFLCFTDDVFAFKAIYRHIAMALSYGHIFGICEKGLSFLSEDNHIRGFIGKRLSDDPRG